MNTGKNTPRLLGAAFLLVAAASLLSGLLLTSVGIPTVGSPDNISETMIIIAGNSTTMQMSIVVIFIESMAIVLLATLLFTSLKNQDEIVARWALGLWIIEAVALAIRGISAFSLLSVSQDFVMVGAPESGRAPRAAADLVLAQRFESGRRRHSLSLERLLLPRSSTLSKQHGS